MTRLAGILTGKQARALVAALAIGATVLTLSTGSADAKTRRENNSNYCFFTRSDGSLGLYEPGAWETTGIGGSWFVCMSNGMWREVAKHTGPGESVPVEREPGPRGGGRR